jgi:hypothetical protein
LLAKYTPPGAFELDAQATIHVKRGQSFNSACTGCAPFPDLNAPACDPKVAPTVVYPLDGVLLPPNLRGLEVQFVPGTGAHLFEVDFENDATDVRIETRCNAIMDTRGDPTGGCALKLDDAMWKAVSDGNRGGDPLTVTVRATTDESCAIASSSGPQVSIAEVDLIGVLYYWKSTVGPITGGEIWRKKFGDPMPEEVVTGVGQSGTCYGCHSISRDGAR